MVVMEEERMADGDENVAVAMVASIGFGYVGCMENCCCVIRDVCLVLILSIQTLEF